MADGHFSEWRLSVSLAAKDEAHLRGFAEWLSPDIKVGFQRGGAVASLSRQDRTVVPLIRERFDIHPRKTFNPPSRLPYEDATLLRCWLVGYIDGDGQVRRQTGRVAVTLNTIAHISWEPFLLELSEMLDFGMVRHKVSHGQTYVALRNCRHNEVVSLLQFIKLYNLPVLERKWGVVDEGHVVITPSGSGKLIEQLLQEGWRGKDITREFGFSPAYISNVRRGVLGYSDARFEASKYNRDKTHCPKGHPLVEGNLIPSALAKGYLRCSECHKTWKRERRQRLRGIGTEEHQH